MSAEARQPITFTRVVLASGAIFILSAPCLNTSTVEARQETPLRTVVSAPYKATPLNTVVTIAPLRGLLEPLLPEGSKIAVLMPPGRSEHGYEFTANDIAQLGRADLVLLVGLGLEPQVDSFLHKQPFQSRRVVELGEVLKLEEAHHPPAQKDAPSDKDPKEKTPDAPGRKTLKSQDEGHKHGLIDPHVWLDPQLVLDAIPEIKQAVLDSIELKGPVTDQTRSDLDKAAAALIERVKTVHNDYTTRLKPFANRAIVTHHAAFGRLAARYGLKVAVVMQPVESSEPTPGQIADVVKAIRKENVKAVFVEPQFNPSAAEHIAKAAGVRLGRLDPLGDGDWFRMMDANLAELVKKLGD